MIIDAHPDRVIPLVPEKRSQALTDVLSDENCMEGSQKCSRRKWIRVDYIAHLPPHENAR